MTHTLKTFKHLIGKLPGFSDRQLEAHLGLYAHYVQKLNDIEHGLEHADRHEADYSHAPYSELKRREAVAFNGAVLHELYFENLAPGKGGPMNSIGVAFAEAFGSWERYVEDLKASASSTPGWVLTTMNRVDGRIHNYILHEHHIGLPVNQDVLLALDCWEHAYVIDYGTSKAEYLGAFMANVDWSVVERRLMASRG